MPIIKKVDRTALFLKSLSNRSVRSAFLAAELLATDISRETPVDTGRLRASIAPIGEIEVDGDIIRTAVFTDVEYAKFVEYGTERQRARAMFRRGAEKSKNNILTLIRRTLPKTNSDL